MHISGGIYLYTFLKLICPFVTLVKNEKWERATFKISKPTLKTYFCPALYINKAKRSNDTRYRGIPQKPIKQNTRKKLGKNGKTHTTVHYWTSQKVTERKRMRYVVTSGWDTHASTMPSIGSWHECHRHRSAWGEWRVSPWVSEGKGRNKAMPQEERYTNRYRHRRCRGTELSLTSPIHHIACRSTPTENPHHRPGTPYPD